MRLRKVAVLGGGPGGLYAARLLKLAQPECDVAVHEQGVPDRTFGFGVGLAAGTQRKLAAADAETLQDIVASGHRHDMQMRVRGRFATVHNDALIGVARTRLLAVLQEHAERSGVVLTFGERTTVDELDADLVIAADGVGSATRTARSDAFGATVEQGEGLYLWAGTGFALEHALFEPVETEFGTFVTHAYPYQPDRSTFLVETDEETWRRAGLEKARDGLSTDATDEASLRYLEQVFADALHGQPLMGNRTQWLRFRTVRAQRWHAGNVVLLGDAAHTAHYSIGSGTKLAMEDAIELVAALGAADDLPSALTAYEHVRRPAVERLQGLARRSQQWWESFPERLDLQVDRLMVAYMSRAGNVPLARFTQSSPDVVGRALADYAGEAPESVEPPGVAQWVLDRPLRRAEGCLPARRAAPELLPPVRDPAGAGPGSLVRLTVGAGSAWSPAGSALVERARRLRAQGSAGVWLVGPADRDAVLDRLDLAERIRRDTGLLTIAALPAADAELAAAALVSGRVDLVDLTDGRVVPYPVEAVRRYREAGLWGSRTIVQEFQRVAAAHAEREALVTDQGALTYAQLDARTDLIAHGLADLGLRPGDPVVFQVTNRPESVLAWYATLKAGLVPVCSLAFHRAHEISQISRLVGAVGHIVDAGVGTFDLVAFGREQAREHPTLRHLVAIGAPAGADVQRLEDLGRGTDPTRARAWVDGVQSGIDPDQVAVFQLSGGTTGVPKVIPRLHAEYWYNAAAYARAWHWDHTSRVAHLIPLIHNAGILCGLHGPHSVGGCLLLASPALDQALPLMARSGATDVLLGHGHYGAVDHPAFPDVAPTLRTVVLSGAKVGPALFGRFEALGVWTGQLFGMGEGLCSVTFPGSSRRARMDTVGTPLSPLDEVRILRPGTESPVPDGEVGELCARGPYTVRGYFDAPEHNARAFTSDGFYRTGDLACLVDVDGVRHLSIEGRIKDVINRGGEKVNAEEVELLLLRHPGIAAAAVVAMPDPRLGERACAYLVASGRPLTLPEVRGHLESLGVAKVKWPERLEWTDELPTTLVGKLDKKRLREDIARRLRAE